MVQETTKELDEKQTKEFEKLVKDIQERQKGFMEDYRGLVKKYKFDFSPIPIITYANGEQLPSDKMKKLSKTIHRALFSEHATLNATFQLIQKLDENKIE